MKKQTNIEMLPTTHKRLKMLAVEMELTLGATILFLLENYRPMPIDEQIKMIQADHVE
jgi:hypothetical protein